MVFGEKAQRIERLEEALATCEREHGPFIELAAEIGRRVTEETIELGADVEQVVDRVVEGLGREQRQALLLNELQKTPPVERLRTLLEVFDDELVREALLPELEYYTGRHKTAAIIDQLAEVAAESRSIDLNRLPHGVRVEMRLHDKEDFLSAKTPRKMGKNYHADRTLSLYSLGEGRYRLLSDTPYKSSWSTKPELVEHGELQFASNRNALEATDSNAAVHWGASVRVVHENKLRDLRLKDGGSSKELGLGEIIVNDMKMFNQKSED